jgi:hypothetical protein
LCSGCRWAYADTRFATELAGRKVRRRACDGLGDEMARAGWFDHLKRSLHLEIPFEVCSFCILPALLVSLPVFSVQTHSCATGVHNARRAGVYGIGWVSESLLRWLVHAATRQRLVM